MKDSWIPMTLAGSALVLFGLVMIRAHVRTWLRHRRDASLEERDRRYYRAQYRRRMQTSGLIVVVGVLLFVLDVVLPRVLGEEALAKAFAVVLILILILTIWIFVLAWSDIAAIRAHSQTALARHRRERRELEEQLAEMQRGKSNGQSRTTDD